MKKRIIGIFIIICILVSLMPAAFAADAHSHTICGKATSSTNSNCGNPNHLNNNGKWQNHKTVLTWDPWESANALPTSGTYYLTGDVTLSSTWVVSESVILDLNGYSITLNNGRGSVIKVANGGTLTLYNCKSTGVISGGNTEKGGGVYVASGATFDMYKATIADNTASVSAGGVYTEIGSRFNMYGGTIGANTSGDNFNLYSDGIFMRGGGTIVGNTTGLWGGVDWTFIVTDAATGNGSLTIEPTQKTDNQREIQPVTGIVYEKGWWREAVWYDGSGGALAISGYPYDCAKITGLTISEGVTAVGSFAAKFTKLTGKVVIPSTVNYFGQEAFQNAPITELVFAKGGTGELCIGPGAMKSMKIKELVLPDDRPVHIHCWAFNGCSILENITLPANITDFAGWTHAEYYGMNWVYGKYKNDSEVFAHTNGSIETVSFGSEEVKNRFLGHDNATVKNALDAFVGLTAYTELQDAVDAAAENGLSVELYNNVTVSNLVIPEGVTLVIPENLTLTNNGTLTNAGTIIGSGTIKNDSIYAAADTAVVADTLTVSGDGSTAYAIVFDLNGGEGEIASIVAEAGADISEAVAQITNPTRAGYKFGGWSKKIPNTMPEGGLSVKAKWNVIVPKYAVTTDVEGIEVPRSAKLGATVEIGIGDDAQIDGIRVLDISGKKVKVERTGDGYSFIMPAGGVKIEEVVNVFKDVENTDYYFDAVLWASDSEITEGTAEDTFSPEDVCTRAQVATLLWRAAGCPEPVSDMSGFTDVDTDSYYGKAVLWAAEQGITTGTSETEFSPDDECSRAQIIAFLARMLKGSAENGELVFDDVDADAYYAQYVLWALEAGITTGTGEGTFEPEEFCTRAQAIVFLWRCIGK